MNGPRVGGHTGLAAPPSSGASRGSPWPTAKDYSPPVTEENHLNKPLEVWGAQPVQKPEAAAGSSRPVTVCGHRANAK